MRLSWKLFFTTIPVFVIFFTLFGCWIVEDSFQSSLNQEAEQCVIENQMFQNSYELTWNGLTEEQQEQTTAKMVVESFSRRQGSKKGKYRIYGEDGTVLYEDSPQTEISGSENRGGSEEIPGTELMGLLDQENNVGYEIVSRGSGRQLTVVSRSSFGIYFEITRDITDLFRNRDILYSRYRTGIFLVTVLAGGVMLLVIMLAMRNTGRLSRTVRRYAQGDYSARARIRSRDEIGRLAEDFNWMAGAMNRQMEQLKDQVRRQEAFTAAFAHELKTPLTSIIGYADTIRLVELTREETDQCAGYISSQGKRLQSLSYKLLELAMADKQEIDFRPIAVSQLLEEVGRILLPSLKKKKVRLELALEEGVIWGDRELLVSLFVNLGDNAGKAAPSGSSVRIEGQAFENGYRVFVEDHGRGVLPEELPRITEAFYMTDKSRSRKEGGAGLGLALCRKIVELHGAFWKFESEPGEGLRVTVWFGKTPDKRGGRPA